MNWQSDEIRQVKLNILPDAINSKGVSIKFGIPTAQKKQFFDTLMNYLTIVESKEATIEVESVIDSETGNETGLDIKITGIHHQEYVQQLQQRVSHFQNLVIQ